MRPCCSLPPACTWASSCIAAAGGEIHGKIDWWGKRQFAYPINKKEAGYYFVVECIANGGALD